MYSIRKPFFFIVLSILFISIKINVLAQSASASTNLGLSIPAIALLDIKTDNEISFSAPNQSISTITPESTSNTWINYSSIVAAGSSNKITVNISGGTVPEQTSIKLSTAADAGHGGGNVGTPIHEVILSESPQDIITNIGSCFTGAGTNNGHQLSYAWIADANITENNNYNNNAIELTYTILASE